MTELVYAAIIQNSTDVQMIRYLTDHGIKCILSDSIFYDICLTARFPMNVTGAVLLSDNTDLSTPRMVRMKLYTRGTATDVWCTSFTPNTVITLPDVRETADLFCAIHTKQVTAYFLPDYDTTSSLFGTDEPRFSIENSAESLRLVNLRQDTQSVWCGDDGGEYLCSNFISIVLPSESTKDPCITVEFVFNPKGRFALTFGECIYDTVKKVKHEVYYDLFCLLRDYASDHDHYLPLFDIYVTAVWDKKQKPKARAKTKK